MPTTDLGITYPCLGPVINPSDFASMATTTEAALSTAFAQSTPLLNRDYVQAFATTPALTVGVTTTMSWSTPPALNNPSGMFSAGTPTVFTIQTAGSYLVTMSISTTGSPTTCTSMRAAVLLAGSEQIWAKWPSDGTASTPNFAITGHLISATVGQQVTATMLWTGTGGPINPLPTIRICKISDL